MATKKPATKKRVKRTVSKPTVRKPEKPKVSLQDMKDMQFVSLFIGGADDIRGNATRCYRYLHPDAKWNSCKVEGSRTLTKPNIQKFLKEQIKIVQKETGLDAAWVLRESVNLYDQATARLPVVREVVNVNDDGDINVFRVEQLVSNPQAALKALELIGKNVTVQAFQENIAVDHTHRLVDMLNARSKLVEEAAAKRLAASVVSTQ